MPDAAPGLRRQFWALAVPNMLAGAIEPLAALVSLGFLGHLDNLLPLAGVALAAIIFDYLYWGCSFLRLATTGLTAQALGAENRDEQAAMFWRPILLAVVLGMVFFLLQKFIVDLAFWLLGGTPEIEAHGRAYFQARIWGAVPALVFLACWGWLLGQQRSDLGMGIIWVFSIVNLLLDYLFIIHWRMGAAGAGYAIMLAELAAALVGLVFIAHQWRGIPVLRWSLILDAVQLRRLLLLSASITARTVMLLTVFASMISISAGFGIVVLAAHTLLNRLLFFGALFLDGLAIALESLAGRFTGSKDMASLAASLHYALRAALAMALLLCAVFALGGETILRLLTEHEPVVQFARAEIWLLCLAILAGAFAFIWDGLYFGLARPKPLFWSVLIGASIYAASAIAARQLDMPALLLAGIGLFMAARSLYLWMGWRAQARAAAAQAS